jgi:two-component system response regulator HydG
MSSGMRVLNIPIGRIPLKDIEKIVMEETLKQSRGNKNIASKILGISTRTLYRKMDSEECSDSDETMED